MEKRGSYESWGVLAAFILAFLSRMSPAKNALVDGNILFYGYDSFYHMRRILYTVDNFPNTLWFDSYLNYPHGLELTWPPLFDQLIAGIALAAGAGNLEMVAALVPPILGAATVIVLYLLARELFGRRVALLSAFMLAIAPVHVARSCFGYTDHHVLEVLLILGSILSMVFALSGRDRRLWFAVLAGVLTAALAYSWIGASIYLGAFLVYAVVQVTLDVRDGVSSKDMIVPFLIAFLIALLLLLPFCSEPWLRPSIFSVVGILVVASILYALSRIFLDKKVPWMIFPPVVVVLGYCFVILVYVFSQSRGIYSTLRSGSAYLFGGELAGKVMEATPIYVGSDFVSFFGLGLLIALFGLAALVVHMRRSPLQRGQVLFLVWTVFTMVLSVAQIRFLYIFSANAAILTGYLFFWAKDRINVAERPGRFDPQMTKILPLALLIVIVLPSAVGLMAMIENEPAIAGDWPEALRWLEDNTPATSNFEEPYAVPEYSVLSWWDYGNWILYRSKRPVVANNFQAGAVDAARFYLSESEEEAMDILEYRGSRYVTTDESMLYEKLPAIVSWIDEDPSSYLNITDDHDVLTFKHSRRFMGTTLAALHLFDGGGMGHLRLIHETNTTRGLIYSTNKVKIFEKVPGARIAGTTRSDRPVGALLNVTSNQGRKFQYFTSVMPRDGRYEITVPYSTENWSEIRAVGAYQVGPVVEVSTWGMVKEVEVSEEDVLCGRVIEVNF
ncbi:MAG: oligosaccharyl transferase, archaeosortase A system-associated [Euryarchaeota archaeon]|nr:oligosaccharyl transferase, archaeosortase A system-associated [Euryarchaeota archaeon]